MKIAFIIWHCYFDSILEDGYKKVIKIVDTEEKAKRFCESAGPHFGMENKYFIVHDFEYVDIYGNGAWIDAMLEFESISQNLQYEKIVIG